MAKKSKRKVEMPVGFGGVSIGKSTARLSIGVDRSNLSLETADELFCNRRLTCRITLDRKGEGDGQKAMFDDANHRIDAIADSKGFRTTTEAFSAGLTFSLNDIDIAELAKFSKGNGKLVISEIGEIPEEAKAGHGEGLDEDKDDDAE